MFQQAAKYNVQMKNILLRLSNIEIKNKQIIKEKDKSVQKSIRSFGEGAEAQGKVIREEQ